MFLKKLFLKTKCINCNRADKNAFCSSCINQLQLLPTVHCSICQSISLKDDQCLECEKRQPLFLKLASIGIYNGLLKNLIYDYKYQNIRDYSSPLSYILADSLKKDLPMKNIDIVTSIPLHKNKLKTRGFNQSELLAREIGRIFKIKYCEIFGRIKNTKPQFALSLQERKENLDSAFEIIYPHLNDKTVLIIDDIFTTGATIQECSKIIQPYTDKIYVAVLARSVI